MAAGSDGDAPGPEPLLLHQQLLQNLEAQLREQLAFGGGGSSPVKLAAQLVLTGAAGSAAVAASPVASSGNSSSSGGGSHVCHEEWQQACAACSDHTLLLPPEDTLPPLPIVPPSAHQLPAAALATITQSLLELDGGSASAQPVQREATASEASVDAQQSRNGQPTIADRMRAAAAARTAQATCTAAAQLPLLIIPPAPLEALAVAASSGAGEDGAAAASDAAQQAQQAQQFDGAAWQEWYRRVASSLSHQLQVLDSIGAGGRSSSSGAGSRRLVGGYGVPLGLPRYTNASPSEQLWGRDGAQGDSAAGLLGVPGGQLLQPQLAAAAPPLDVVLQHSLLQPVRIQVDAASGALCTALLRHGLLRQVRLGSRGQMGCAHTVCCVHALLHMQLCLMPTGENGHSALADVPPLSCCPPCPMIPQLSALRDTYLLGSPLLEPFVSCLLRSIR